MFHSDGLAWNTFGLRANPPSEVPALTLHVGKAPNREHFSKPNTKKTAGAQLLQPDFTEDREVTKESPTERLQ